MLTWLLVALERAQRRDLGFVESLRLVHLRLILNKILVFSILDPLLVRLDSRSDKTARSLPELRQVIFDAALVVAVGVLPLRVNVKVAALVKVLTQLGLLASHL